MSAAMIENPKGPASKRPKKRFYITEQREGMAEKRLPTSVWPGWMRLESARRWFAQVVPYWDMNVEPWSRPIVVRIYDEGTLVEEYTWTPPPISTEPVILDFP